MVLMQLAVIPYLTRICEFCKNKEIKSIRIEYVLQRVSETPDLYNWEFYSSVDKLKELRKLALRHFISDYADGVKEKRYIKGMLPRLPFGDKTFDLVLSGHLFSHIATDLISHLFCPHW